MNKTLSSLVALVTLQALHGHKCLVAPLDRALVDISTVTERSGSDVHPRILTLL